MWWGQLNDDRRPDPAELRLRRRLADAFVAAPIDALAPGRAEATVGWHPAWLAVTVADDGPLCAWIRDAARDAFPELAAGSGVPLVAVDVTAVVATGANAPPRCAITFRSADLGEAERLTDAAWRRWAAEIPGSCALVLGHGRWSATCAHAGAADAIALLLGRPATGVESPTAVYRV